MTSISIYNLKEGVEMQPSDLELEMELLDLDDPEVVAVGSGYFGAAIGAIIGFLVGNVEGAVVGAVAGDWIGDGISEWWDKL
ncbi:MAG: hypothetical protein KME30_00490 [Iphinoe sp. HA4291-MV1]|jgi:outer membrane lipoprotein SlyB|nr:hypothetical protein [Iphinoe sp. HA4291-MV1]